MAGHEIELTIVRQNPRQAGQGPDRAQGIALLRVARL
jgi:hypothetical protein